MKMKKMLMMFFVLAFSSSIFAQSNGSFEEGLNDPGDYWITLFGDNTTAITNWTVSGHSVDYIGSYWQASDGERSIDLNGLGTGAISQTVETIPGMTYQATFDMSGNPDAGAGVKLMSVSANGASSQTFQYITGTNTRDDMQWASHIYYFTATDSTTLLTFASQIEGWFGPVLDNVNVEITTQVCHRNSGKKGSKTLTVGASAVSAHLDHGDSPGPCA
jgi:choice-of-anchor C domain-containing protein